MERRKGKEGETVMKHFFFTINDRRGSYTTLKIFQIKKNTAHFRGYVKVNELSTKGYRSEVFNWLINNKYIPKSYFKLSSCAWSGEGYYCKKVEDKGILIQEG